ncbi:MAG: DUF87 domain-containing protein, partial [Anaerolineales bacterium]
PIDGLFNSHIAIFGNTGSGKSNTLAALYQGFIKTMRHINSKEFESNCRLMFFDFNGEYTDTDCLTKHKKIYNLSTLNEKGDKIPLSASGLLDIEVLSILSDATEKTQRPFLRRALSLHDKVMSSDDPLQYARNILRLQILRTLQMSDKVRVDLLLDYFGQILPNLDNDGNPVDI